MHSFPKTCFVSLSFALVFLLTGCALENTAAPSVNLVPSTAISGTVHGGSQPILGAKVYLLAVNPTGYAGPGLAPSSANASVSLLTPLAGSVTPDTIGNYATTSSPYGTFSLSGAGVYSCTAGFAQGTGTPVVLSGTEQVYLYVLGGTPLNAGGPNASSGMLVALGPCNAPATKVTVNEITTVAAAYAFAGFASDATHIGSSGTSLALAGLNNAYANVANLAVVSSGTATANSSNLTPPAAALITIADILAACVNGTTANSSCQTVFAYTKSAGANGTAATDTATAAINLAHYPYPSSAGMTALWGLVPGTGAPFAGGLSSQPNDFTLGLYLTSTYSSTCFNNSAHGLAIDASGSAWTLGGHGLCKFSSNGTLASPNYNGYTGGGYLGGSNLAIDTSGNVWVAGNVNNTLSEFSNNGAARSGTGFTSGGLSTPLDVAIDASGYVWIANQGGTLSKFDGSGNAVSGSPFSDGGSNDAFTGVAIDASGNVWASNTSNGSLSKFGSNGGVLSPKNGYYGNGGANGNGGLSNPYDVAIDVAGNVWAPNHYYSSLSKYSSGGNPISGPNGYQGNGGISNPSNIAIDPTGNVWVANTGNNTVNVFANSGTEISGDPAYKAGGTIYAPVNVAIDGSGNVWVTNSNGSLVELIGAAAPVVTPIVANLVAPYGSSAVNRP